MILNQLALLLALAVSAQANSFETKIITQTQISADPLLPGKETGDSATARMIPAIFEAFNGSKFDPNSLKAVGIVSTDCAEDAQPLEVEVGKSTITKLIPTLIETSNRSSAKSENSIAGGLISTIIGKYSPYLTARKDNRDPKSHFNADKCKRCWRGPSKCSQSAVCRFFSAPFFLINAKPGPCFKLCMANAKDCLCSVKRCDPQKGLPLEAVRQSCYAKAEDSRNQLTPEEMGNGDGIQTAP